MNNLYTYIKQRFNVWLWSAVTLLLIVLSLTSFSITYHHLISFPFILYFLLIMRLNDDLESAEIDRGKINRNYTEEPIRKELFNFYIVFLFILIIALFLVDYNRGKLLAFFIIVNHILYFFLYRFSSIRIVLPLLKYPFIVYLLTLEMTINCLILFCICLLFEYLSDKHKGAAFIVLSSYIVTHLILIS